MATLAAGIETALGDIIRSPGGTTLAAHASLTQICTMAAARVQLKLGTISDDTDENYDLAVAFGMMFGLELWCVKFEQKMDAQQQRLYDSLRKDWDDVHVTLRHEAQVLGVSDPDTDVLDETFPNRRAESGDDDA